MDPRNNESGWVLTDYVYNQRTGRSRLTYEMRAGRDNGYTSPQTFTHPDSARYVER